MSEKIISAGVTILVAIIGVAFLAVLVSRNSNTSNVITAASGGFKCALLTALHPIGVSVPGDCLTPSVTSDVIFR